ncbi:heterodisulfide reductase-related iron-sulfur binding cluster [Acidobacteriota bacterium]
MLTFPEKTIFLLIILATFAAFWIPVIYRFRVIRSGQPEGKAEFSAKRTWGVLAKVFLQKCTLKNERLFTGFIHVFIFYGALSFDTATINHTIEGFIPDFYLFGISNFGLFFSFLVDAFAVLVLMGIIFFIIKRYVVRPKAYATTLLDSGLIYFFIITATLSYLYFECFSIAYHPGTERLAFLGNGLAGLIINSGLSLETLAVHYKISWWLHILIVYIFIAYVPHSKYFHMFAGPLNLFFSPDKSSGELKALDIEKAEVFGVEKASDYSWKDFLDTIACMECGRCQDVCPAFASEKPLSPKMIIFNLRNHLMKEGKKIIARNRDETKPLISDVYTEDEIWTCTTCGACMHVCPVEIKHIPKLIGVRQSQVLMESKFPSELNAFFRNMETNSNPWGIGFSDRANWTDGLNVKLISEHPDVEYLYWIGCSGSFDEEGKKITKSMVSILEKAGINFAILGTEEKCCGDSAKRLGNEYLFQIQAGENIETFKKYHIKKIIVTCPHGYNTFKNEYPRLIDILPDISPEIKEELKKIEVIHHVQLLAKLIRENRLPLKPKSNDLFTYHDSCYLSRHNGIISEPREILQKLSKNKIIEPKNNKEHSFCCGAGGGLMWTEESLGRRINHLRTEEVTQTKTDIAVTSCSFCRAMIQDGLKDQQREDMKVKDIAQLVDEAL